MLFRRRILLVTLVALTALACHQVTGVGEQAETLTTCTQTQASFIVTWVNDIDEAARACSRDRLTYGCAVKLADGRWHLTVPRPKDFNDHTALIILGHEVCHGLGGVHR